MSPDANRQGAILAPVRIVHVPHPRARLGSRLTPDGRLRHHRLVKRCGWLGRKYGSVPVTLDAAGIDRSVSIAYRRDGQTDVILYSACRGRIVNVVGILFRNMQDRIQPKRASIPSATAGPKDGIPFVLMPRKRIRHIRPGLADFAKDPVRFRHPGIKHDQFRRIARIGKYAGLLELLRLPRCIRTIDDDLASDFSGSLCRNKIRPLTICPTQCGTKHPEKEWASEFYDLGRTTGGDHGG
jgi:hypothetical protein